MKKLIKVIKDFEKKKIALAHFNVASLEQLKAVANVGRKLNVPVIVGLSEGEREYFGIHFFRDAVAEYNMRYGREGGFWLYTNADHTHSFEKIVEAARLGFQAVLFDGSRLPFSENVSLTKKAKMLVKRINEDILVEGELGYLGNGSEILDKISEEVAVAKEKLTSPEEAEEFLKQTGVDLLAPAVGSFHGLLKENQPPQLDIERIKAIKEKVEVPLVLHGGSGVKEEDFLKAIEAGISIVHISTELRLIWRQYLEEVLKAKPEEIAIYKIMPEVIKAMEALIEKRIKLFMKID